MDLEDEVNSPIYFHGSSNPMTTTIAPNHFLLSTYEKNLRSYHSSQLHLNQSGHQKLNTSSYKCCLCRKIVDDATLTCAKCVNSGRFCPPKHDTCSNKRRQLLASLLNPTDYEEFQEFSAKNSINNPPHLQCSDRTFLLKKFQTEKNRLQNEYQIKMESTIESFKMAEEISIRKNRLILVQQHIEKLREQIEHRKQMNILIEDRKLTKENHIKLLQRKIDDIKTVLRLSNETIREKNDRRIEYENKLHHIRRQRLNETYKYVFPIEHAPSIEDHLASTMRALSSAQQSIAEETGSDWSENDETSNMTGERYQIVSSCLPVNGDYQIPKLLLTIEVDKQNTDSDSFQSTLSHELYEVLSALSHACQLINVIAFYLHIALPFRLHQLEFNTDNLTGDRLRADIAKLNANIVTSCMSQGIPMENTRVTHTLENLWKLLTYKQYLSRPKPVIFSQQYIDAMEEEVNEISRAYVTEYWFDDVEKDVNDLLNSDEWETVPQDYNIPDDPSIHERLGSLPSFTNHHHHHHHHHQQQQQNISVMSNSIDFLRNRGSNLINSVFRSFARP